MSELTRQQARDRFSEAFDGVLDEDTQLAFDALLAEDAELREEFEDFSEVLEATQGLALGRGIAGAPDLLPGIKRKIQERHGKRFLRDRFMQKQQNGVPWIVLMLAALLFLIAGVGYFGWSAIQRLLLN